MRLASSLRSAVTTVTAAAVALAAPAARAADPGLDAGQAAKISAIVSAELARQHVPGIAIAIGRGNDMAYARGFGERDVATHAPVEASTVFEIASVTKQFTAAAVMQLVQSGRVRLDAPIATYLSDVPSGDRITVRELLTHTSGLPNFTDVPGFFQKLASQPAAPADLVALVARQPLDFAPGTRWAYSNTNYAVLGLLIAKIGGEPYGDYLATHVIAPAGLTTTRYSATYLAGPHDALPYDERDGEFVRPAPFDLGWAYAAGGLWSDAPDLVRWQQALYDGRVVDASSLAAMTTPARLPDGTSAHYGFGLAVGRLYGLDEIFHSGGIPGFSSFVAVFPSERLQIAVLGNRTFDAGAIVRDVVPILVPSVAARAAAEARATPPPDDPATAALAASLVSQVQRGRVDPALLDAKMNDALAPPVLRSVAQQLAPFGTPSTIALVSRQSEGSFTVSRYRVRWPQGAWIETIALDGDGKVAGLFFAPDPTPSPSPSATPSPAP